MSENHSPSPSGEPPYAPPPSAPGAPAATPALPAYPVQPVPQPMQSYPGAPPAYAPPGQAPPGFPPAQPGYAPYGVASPPVFAPRPTSGLAVTALVCGIAGAVLFWALIPVLASIAAVITGHLALGQIKRDPGVGGRGLAITGLILGYVVIAISAFTLVATIISFLFVGAFSLPFLLSS